MERLRISPRARTSHNLTLAPALHAHTAAKFPKCSFHPRIRMGSPISQATQQGELGSWVRSSGRAQPAPALRQALGPVRKKPDPDLKAAFMGWGFGPGSPRPAVPKAILQTQRTAMPAPCSLRPVTPGSLHGSLPASALPAQSAPVSPRSKSLSWEPHRRGPVHTADSLLRSDTQRPPNELLSS